MQRIGPVLDPDPPLVERVQRARDVAGREHPGAGSEGLVDEDAVIHLKAGVGGELDARQRADADDDEIAFDLATAAGAHPRNGCRPFERLDALAEEISTPWSRCTSR